VSEAELELLTFLRSFVAEECQNSEPFSYLSWWRKKTARSTL